MKRLFASITGAAAVADRTDSVLVRGLITVIELPARLLLAALVVRDLWLWFLEPVWQRPITYGQAVGLLLLLFVLHVFIFSPRTDTPLPSVRIKLSMAAARAISLVVVWGAGAAIHAIFL